MQGERKIIFRIRGSASIERAVALREAFLKLLNDPTVGTVQIEGSEIVSADLSFFQILLCSCRSFTRDGKSLQFLNFSPELIRTLSLSGFRRHVRCETCTRDKCSFQQVIGEAVK